MSGESVNSFPPLEWGFDIQCTGHRYIGLVVPWRRDKFVPPSSEREPAIFCCCPTVDHGGLPWVVEDLYSY